jgi:putative membrane protein
VSSVTPNLRRARWRRVAVAAVVLVPLAFAGLFVGALSQTTSSIGDIPAAVVNSDQLVYQTAADGTKTPVYAGRQLVTELTGGKAGFDWTISNKADAEADLKSGKIDAILTVPKNFSASILSLSGTTPVQAKLSIHTDDAHSYLTGAVAGVVGSSLSSAFGKAVTENYITGLYSGVGSLGTALSKSADGATSLSSGVSSYTSGVDQLSSGLGSLNAGASKLGALTSGVSTYTGGVSQLSAALTQANAALQADPSSANLAAVNALTAQLAQAASGGSALASQTGTAISGIQGGIAQSAAGAAQLSAGSASLDSGASQLASGLASGAAQLPSTSAASAAKTAKVASDPVAVTVQRDNPIKNVGQVIAILFVPLGLWVGALAVFLVLRPITRRALTSTAANGRIVLSTLARASLVTVSQAVLLTLLIHLAVGVSWSLLPATFGFSVLLALGFTAFHYLLTIGLGRGGLVVSLFLLAVQITSTGGLYPVQLLAKPFQVISPFLPLTYGVQGMQAILAGGSPGPAIASAAVVLAFGVGSVLVAMLAVRRTRRARALGLTPEFRSLSLSKGASVSKRAATP